MQWSIWLDRDRYIIVCVCVIPASIHLTKTNCVICSNWLLCKHFQVPESLLVVCVPFSLCLHLTTDLVLILVLTKVMIVTAIIRSRRYCFFCASIVELIFFFELFVSQGHNSPILVILKKTIFLVNLGLVTNFCSCMVINSLQILIS